MRGEIFLVDATDVDLRLAFFSRAGSVALDAQVLIQVLMGAGGDPICRAGYVESVPLTELTRAAATDLRTSTPATDCGCSDPKSSGRLVLPRLGAGAPQTARPTGPCQGGRFYRAPRRANTAQTVFHKICRSSVNDQFSI
jgi:hypothetical protein